MKKSETNQPTDHPHSAPAEGEREGEIRAAEPEIQSGETAPEPRGSTDRAAGEDELAQARDRHLRLAAEFENYRKRVTREREESWNRAQAQLVEKLLDALDDLQRVTEFTADAASADTLLEGAKMAERKLMRTLEAAGLEPLDAEGKPFDPTVHEAITTVRTEDAEEDETVADVFQSGYRFKGTLLRPARVRVKRYEG